MARILYSVCGIGLGHAMRSAEIIEKLQKNNEILISSYGGALNFLKSKFENVEGLRWFKLIFENGSYAKSKTFLHNMPLAPKVLAKNFLILLKAIKKFQPDFIISDFEVSALYLAELLNIPNVTVSNMHIMKEFSMKLPIKDSIVYYLTELPILEAFPTDKFYITYFFKPKKPKIKNAKFFYPIIRKKVKNLKRKKEDFILVYLGIDELPNLTTAFKIFKYENFVLYTNKKLKMPKNVKIKKISDSFADDLASCKAVICHGGYTILSESAFLQKPALVTTDKSFFERYFNGWCYEHLGFGMFAEKFNAEKLQEFLDSQRKFEKNLKKANIKDDTKAILKSFKKEIKSAEKRNAKKLHNRILNTLKALRKMI